MAERRPPGNNDVLDIQENRKEYRTNNEFKTFTNFDMFCVFFSMGTFVADLTTDIILVADYWRKEHFYWSLGTFLLILVPAILIQLFSMRWHLMDEAVSLWHWITHVFLVGVLHRYTVVLKTGFEARESKSAHDVQRLYLQQSDICMLHLFESFLEAAPQLILQLYIMVVMRDWHFFTGLSAVASLCSLSWAVVSYVRALRRSRAGTCGASCRAGRPLSLALQATWRGAMLAARLAALLMFAVAFQHWIFTLLGVHWLVMTMWVIQQKTDFCPSRLEEVFYNCVVGVIYCFCFFNLREGQARYRMIAFYAVMVSQNLVCLLLFLFLHPGAMNRDLVIITSSIIISGTFLGLSSMLIYYRWLHPAGPIRWWSDKEQSPEQEQSPQPKGAHSKANESSADPLANVTLRSLKSAWHDASENTTKCEESPQCAENSPQSDTECTDKKLLLDHWIARAGSPTFASAPIDNADATDVTGIEFYSVANTPEKNNRIHPDKIGNLNVSFQFENETGSRVKCDNSNESNTSIKNKRRGICSTTELGVKFTKMEQDQSCLKDIPEGNEAIDMTAQKRRGICSSGQLKDDMERMNSHRDQPMETLRSVSDGSEDDLGNDGKTSSDSLNLDLDLSFSDINSSDINEFNENIVQKLCLSTLKNIKNVHQDADIRNIQKIALEILKDLYSKGGVKDDQDLESELSSSVGRDLETPSEVLSAHDYENICAVNIAREAWGLRSWRGCSDMGGSPPPAPPPPPPSQRRPAPPPPHHNYITTVAYELAKCEDSRCQLMNTPEYHKEPESSVFIAKPYVDQNEGIFPISTPLEPILEELDEIIDGGSTMRRRQRHNSESALVATIDEIRNDTITDSPRNVYHRAVWESPCPNFESETEKNYTDTFRKATMNNLRKVLWKEEPRNEGCPRDQGDQNLHPKKLDYTKEECRKFPPTNNPVRVALKTEKSPKNMCEFKLKNDCDVGNKHFRNMEDRQKVGKSNSHKKSNGARVHFQKKDPFRQSPKVKMARDEPITKLPIEFQHNCYEEVSFRSQLVKDTTKKCNITSTEDVSNLGISSSLQSLIDRDCQSDIAMPKTNTETRPNAKRNNGNRPRRKFSLLREKFEPKSNKHSDEEMLFQSLESVRSLTHELDITSSRSCLKNNANIVFVNQEAKVSKDKENLTPPALERGKCPLPPREEVVLSLTPCDLPIHSEQSTANLKEKRTIFLEQVLSPPKMNSWIKKNLNEYVN